MTNVSYENVSRRSIRDLLSNDFDGLDKPNEFNRPPKIPTVSNVTTYVKTPNEILYDDEYIDTEYINKEYYDSDEFFDDGNYSAKNTYDGYDMYNDDVSNDNVSSNSSTSGPEEPDLDDLSLTAIECKNRSDFMDIIKHQSNQSIQPSQLQSKQNSNSNSSITDPPIYVNHQVQTNRINTIISNYIINPTGTLILKDLVLDKIPIVLKTIDTIKRLTLEQCSLEYISNLPPNLETLDIRCNKIQSITTEDLPETLTILIACNNKIRHVDLSRSFHIQIVNLANNPLDQSVAFPPNVRELLLTASFFSNVDVLTKLLNLKVLKLSSINKSKLNNLGCIDKLPNTITDLTLSRVNVFSEINGEKIYGHIGKLPEHLMKFTCQATHIKSFGFTKFPIGLSYLDIYDNEIIHLPTLPDTVSYVDISNNTMLMSVANIPQNIECYDAINNINLKFSQEQITILDHLKTQSGVTINLATYDNNNDLDTDLFGHPLIESYNIDNNNNSLYQNPNSNSNSNSTFNINNYFGNSGTSTSVSTSDAIGGFGSLGTRRNFNRQFNGQSSSDTGGITFGRPRNQKPKLPPYVTKLMGHDGFVPTKKQKIKHSHIYFV